VNVFDREGGRRRNKAGNRATPDIYVLGNLRVLIFLGFPPRSVSLVTNSHHTLYVSRALL
jgi:hypothetical protein